MVYTTPELRLVGAASTVVLGGTISRKVSEQYTPEANLYVELPEEAW